MTLPEILLWNLLRKNPDGVHFRRQHAIGDYILDFYSADAKVCIEVDGLAHDMGNQAQFDAKRDAWLLSQGIETVRIQASEVLKSAETIADGLVRRCKRG
jgi:very-short-patch-repair endonuclease